MLSSFFLFFLFFQRETQISLWLKKTWNTVSFTYTTWYTVIAASCCEPPNFAHTLNLARSQSLEGLFTVNNELNQTGLKHCPSRWTAIVCNYWGGSWIVSFIQRLQHCYIHSRVANNTRKQLHPICQIHKLCSMSFFSHKQNLLISYKHKHAGHRPVKLLLDSILAILNCKKSEHWQWNWAFHPICSKLTGGWTLQVKGDIVLQI